MSDIVTQMAPRAARPSTALRLLSRGWLALMLLVMLVIFTAFRPEMLVPGNITTVLRAAAISAIMFLGLTSVMAAGKIDVSFMQVAALANMIAAAMLAGGYGWPVAILAALGAGMVVGFANGVLIAALRLPALIVTIATGGIAGSIAAALGKGTSVRIVDTGMIGEVLTMTLGPVPVILLFAAVLYLVAWWAQERLTLGHYVYAVAENEEAVIEAGIPARRLLMSLFIGTGLLSAIAGVILAASLSSGQPMIGSSYFIDGLTAVLLGGMMLRPGQPNVIGTATAVILLAVLTSGAALMGWPDYQRQIVQGALLIFGIAVAGRLAKRRTGK
jgi:ribose transport system permease protein